MKPYDVLNESIKFATKQLEDFKSNRDLSDIPTMVITALYRKIIELSEGVRVAAANGLYGPAELNYRGLIEACLAFKFILKEPGLIEERAKAYKIGYHKHQIEAGEFALEKNLPGEEREGFQLSIQYHKNELEKEELQEVLAKYIQRQGNSTHIPKWYSLEEGVTSLRTLINYLGDSEREKEIMWHLYGFLSSDAHNYMSLRSITKDGDTLTINPVKAHFNSNKDEYNFVHVRSLLTSTITKFTSSMYPNYQNHLRDFANRIRPHIRRD